MVFGSSVLNRVYNFKRVCPGPVLDGVWLQDSRRVFGTGIRDVSQLSFHLRFTVVNAKVWDFSPSLLGSILFYLL